MVSKSTKSVEISNFVDTGATRNSCPQINGKKRLKSTVHCHKSHLLCIYTFMKRIITYLAALLCICSCEMTIMDGKWDPIELDKKSVTFPPEGGQNTVSALNYNRWWINGGYESGATDYVHAGSSEGDEAHTYDVLDGGWYHVSVPDNGKSNTIIITVDPHYDAKPRQARIDMQAGNAFTSITIYQQ